MALLLEHSIFTHVPKTGGTWLAEAVRRAGLVQESLGPVHATPRELKSHQSYVPRPVTFAIVRHPATWYASLWAHRMDENWCEISARDWFSPASLERWALLTDRCKSRSFPEFVERCVEAFPDGWLSALYDTYITPGTTVGRFENLVDDTIAILRRAGERFDETIIRGTEPQNVRGAVRKHHRRTIFTPSLLELIYASERRSYARFGYEEQLPRSHPGRFQARRSLMARLFARVSAR